MINSRIRRAFNEAIHQARTKLNMQSQQTSEPKTSFIHGASVIDGARIIGSGYNQYSRNYVDGEFYLSLHAELAALKNSPLPAAALAGQRGSGRCSRLQHYPEEQAKVLFDSWVHPPQCVLWS